MKRAWCSQVCRRAWRAVKFWWQRRTRGWDDSDLWNLDVALAQLILPRLKAFAVSPPGYPGHLDGPEQWAGYLAEMIAAFDLITSDRYWTASEADNEVIRKGLARFAEYYGALWT